MFKEFSSNPNDPLLSKFFSLSILEEKNQINFNAYFFPPPKIPILALTLQTFQIDHRTTVYVLTRYSIRHRSWHSWELREVVYRQRRKAEKSRSRHLNSSVEGSYIQKKKKKWAGPTGEEGPRQRAAAATGKKKKLQPLFGAPSALSCRTFPRYAYAPTYPPPTHLTTWFLTLCEYVCTGCTSKTRIISNSR